MRTLSRLVIGMALLVPALLLAQGSTTVDLAPLHFDLAGEWTIEWSRAPVEGRGPHGEEMLLSPVRRPVGSSLPPVTEAARGFSASRMREQAERGGATVVRPVQSISMPQGRVGFSAASERTFRGRKMFFVQYLIAAPDVGFYLTFEGEGDAQSAAERFDRAISTQRWDE